MKIEPLPEQAEYISVKKSTSQERPLLCSGLVTAADGADCSSKTVVRSLVAW